MTTHTFGDTKPVTWTALKKPSREEVLALGEQYNIPLSILEELLVPSPRSRVRASNNCLFIALHFPGVTESDTLRGDYEVDCIIGSDFFITVQYEPIESMTEFEKSVSMTQKKHEGEEVTGLTVLYELITTFYANITTQLNDISETLKRIEERVFNNQEDRMVRVISKTNRKLIDHRRSLQFHEVVLEDALEEGVELFGEEAGNTLLKLLREFRNVNFLIDNNKMILDDLRDTNDLLLNTKTNHIIKILTLITFITIPVVVSVEVLRDPLDAIQHTPLSIFFILLGACIITISLALFFKHKKWF